MAAFTTNRIAQCAGVSIGSLYDYFSSKRAVLVALARQLQAQDQDALRAALAAPGADPIGALVRAQVDAFVAVLATQPGFDAVAPLRLMTAAQAALGIARAIADGSFDAWDKADDALAREATSLIKGFLAQDTSAA